MENYYAILGIPFNADEVKIKRVYKSLAIKYHPDRNPSLEAEARFKQITEAYNVLGDKSKRRQYDLKFLPSQRVNPNYKNPNAASGLNNYSFKYQVNYNFQDHSKNQRKESHFEKENSAGKKDYLFIASFLLVVLSAFVLYLLKQ